MVGFKSKRIMSVERYADPMTMDHIIDLQKRLAQAELQRDNALDKCVELSRLIWNIREMTTPKPYESPNAHDEDRNC